MHTLQPNIPDHNSLQQLGLSHSLLLVSAAPGHFVWSHQWHQICTAERQPLVGGRQGRWQQQWPGWTLFLRLLLLYTLTICSLYFMHCNQSSWQSDKLQLLLFLLLSLPTSLARTHVTDSVWNLIGGPWRSRDCPWEASASLLLSVNVVGSAHSLSWHSLCTLAAMWLARQIGAL